ncbi:CAP domain-containing protein [bacterium]|nr:CAP domain-containing protein [bacterium]
MKSWFGAFFILINTAHLPAQNEAKPVSMNFLSDLEKQVYYELNRVRSNPKEYAKHVKKVMGLFDGNLMKYPGETAIMTTEGESAAAECYDFLMAAEPVDTLRVSRGLSLAARDHADDQGETTETGHTGRDGSSPFDRIERYGQWLSTAGENVDYGNNIARRIVLSLIIDDGVPSRGHRKNIFNPQFKVVGIACGPHQQYRYMCVMDLAGGFKAKKTGATVRGED